MDMLDPAVNDTMARVEAELSAEEPGQLDKLRLLASSAGNFAEAISKVDLARIGNEVCDDYDTDKRDRKGWEDTAREALASAKQERKTGKRTFPWPSSSNVNYPLLASGALQFNARAYPAVVKGDEAVLCKVIGKDSGRPRLGPDGKPIMLIPGPDGQPMPIPPGAPPPPQGIPMQPMWQIPPGAKGKRAQRVADYMNTTIFYRMEDWEGDTDSLLQ